MNFYFTLTAVTFLISSPVIISQSSADNFIPVTETFSRFRLQAGYVDGRDIKNDYINAGYRATESERYSSSPFTLGFALEAGANTLISFYGNQSEVYFLPYIKGGPELKILDNLFLAASAGFTSPLIYYAVVGFAGINSSYLVDLSGKTFLELECGFHTAGYEYTSLFYLAVGIAFL